MIGLVVVFGVVGIAFLSLNTQQTSLFTTQQKVNELQHDRNMESFESKILRCKDDGSDRKARFIEIRINNTSTQSLNLNSFILYNLQYQNITNTNYTKINIPFQTLNFKFNLTGVTYDLDVSDTPDYSATRMIMMTDFGNKIIINYNFDVLCT